MHYRILLSVVEEISSRLTGGRVDRVIQGEDDGMFLLARNGGKNFVLLLSPHRSLPRLHLVSQRPRASDDPHPFLLHLRSRLVGNRIMRIILINNDRVVEIDFAGQSAAHRLFFELTGSSANIFLTDVESRVLASYYPVSAGQGSRTLLPGARYEPPAVRAHRLQNSAPGEMFDAARPNQSAEVLYGRLEEQRKTTALRTEIRAATRLALARAERRHLALSTDLRTAEQADQFKMMGDLILANLNGLRQGIESADLEGYDGTRLPVRLDPSLSPAKNADRYFKKYKKARSGLPIIVDRLERTEQEILRLQRLLVEMETVTDQQELSDLRFEVPGVKGQERGRRTEKEDAQKALPGIRKIHFRGWEILVGRNASGNDQLTTRLARPHDLWLHAEGLPGSHVLVKNPSKTVIPPEVLIKAASLAALHSRGKGAEKVPVAYTEARNVKKPKGAKPGLVVLSQRKTVVVRPDTQKADMHT